MGTSTLSIGLLLPEVLGTYGDSGNARILAQRAQWRGIDAKVELVSLGDPVPESFDIYTIGGGEDTAQALAVDHLARHRGLHKAVAAGRPVLAICAGMQVLGTSYTDAQGRQVEGAGLLDCVSVPQGHRTIGELVTRPLLEELSEPLTGFENHGGATVLGSDARPLGSVLAGHGNGTPPGEEETGVDGCVQGPIIATYMHGPALARNPQLADLLLARAVGELPDFLDEQAGLGARLIATLRQQRLAAAGLADE